MYYVFLTLLVNILRYIKIPKKAGERSPASTHIRLYFCLSYIAHVYTQKPGVGKTNKRHFSWIKSPDIFRPCCVLCSIAGAFCSFSLMSHLVTSSGISSLFSLLYLTPFFCILFVCVRPQCFAPLLLSLLSHFLYTRHFIIHHVAPPLFSPPLSSSCFRCSLSLLLLSCSLLASYRSPPRRLFPPVQHCRRRSVPSHYLLFSLSLIIPHTYSFISSLPLFLRSLFHFCVIHHTPARLLHHSHFFLDQHPAAYYRDQHSFPYYRPPLFVFFLLSVTSIYYFDTSVFDMSLFTINNTCILQYSVVTVALSL